MSGPSLVIPNSDPACRCTLKPGELPGDAVELTGIIPAGDMSDGTCLADGQEFTITIDPACPHHGHIVRQAARHELQGISIGAPTSKYGGPVSITGIEQP